MQDDGIISKVVAGREAGVRLVPAGALGAAAKRVAAAAAAPLPLPHVCPPQPLLALTGSPGDYIHISHLTYILLAARLQSNLSAQAAYIQVLFLNRSLVPCKLNSIFS
jgi:hypothetical protein